MPSVLFVCTANICRSPMAEVLFADQVKRKAPDPALWQVASAGTWAQEGYPASRNSETVMRERGLDLSHHSSHIVTPEMMSRYNLILVMEANHKEALVYEFPDLAGRFFMLSEMSGEKKSVEDPIGQDLNAYRQSADEIQHWIEQGWEEILLLA